MIGFPLSSWPLPLVWCFFSGGTAFVAADGCEWTCEARSPGRWLHKVVFPALTTPGSLLWLVTISSNKTRSQLFSWKPGPLNTSSIWLKARLPGSALLAFLYLTSLLSEVQPRGACLVLSLVMMDSPSSSRCLLPRRCERQARQLHDTLANPSQPVVEG